jgi:hypothetical protein
LSVNSLFSLVESYSLATKQSPPPGQILGHSQITQNKRKLFEGSRGFRAWWAAPGRKYVLWACGWRPDLGEHYRVQRPNTRRW